MRATGPIRFRAGDGSAEAYEAAHPYIPLARVTLGKVKNMMQLGGLQTGWHTETLPDGTVIRAYSSYGMDTVHVFPVLAAPPAPQAAPPTEPPAPTAPPVPTPAPTPKPRSSTKFRAIGDFGDLPVYWDITISPDGHVDAPMTFLPIGGYYGGYVRCIVPETGRIYGGLYVDEDEEDGPVCWWEDGELTVSGQYGLPFGRSTSNGSAIVIGLNSDATYFSRWRVMGPSGLYRPYYQPLGLTLKYFNEPGHSGHDADPDADPPVAYEAPVSRYQRGTITFSERGSSSSLYSYQNGDFTLDDPPGDGYFGEVVFDGFLDREVKPLMDVTDAVRIVHGSSSISYRIQMDFAVGGFVPTHDFSLVPVRLQSISGDGSTIVGGVPYLATNYLPAVWANGALIELSMAVRPSAYAGMALYASQDGAYVVGTLQGGEGGPFGGGSAIVRWTPAGSQVVAWSILSVSAVGISRDGQTIGGSYYWYDDGGNQHRQPFVWTAGGGGVDLPILSNDTVPFTLSSDGAVMLAHDYFYGISVVWFEGKLYRIPTAGFMRDIEKLP